MQIKQNIMTLHCISEVNVSNRWILHNCLPSIGHTHVADYWIKPNFQMYRWIKRSFIQYDLFYYL